MSIRFVSVPANIGVRGKKSDPGKYDLDFRLTILIRVTVAHFTGFRNKVEVTGDFLYTEGPDGP